MSRNKKQICIVDLFLIYQTIPKLSQLRNNRGCKLFKKRLNNPRFYQTNKKQVTTMTMRSVNHCQNYVFLPNYPKTVGDSAFSSFVFSLLWFDGLTFYSKFDEVRQSFSSFEIILTGNKPKEKNSNNTALYQIWPLYLYY